MAFALRNAVGHLGATMHDAVGRFGVFVQFAGESLGALARHPVASLRWRVLAPLLAEVGTASKNRLRGKL